MSTSGQSRLWQLSTDFGQSPWLDNLQRTALVDGSLQSWLDRGVRGLTSNPTIFNKSIGGSTAYDEQFTSLISSGATPTEAYWELVLADIERACEIFAPVHAGTDGLDGYVSVEVDPSLAHDRERTEAAARQLHERISRRNVMIKIPATPEGLGPVTTMIAEGRSINVTLIFSLERYREVAEAYLAGLEQRAGATDDDLSSVASVASFFVSRVDTLVDASLAALEAPSELHGVAAITQARLAYRIFSEVFSGPRWEALAARGARPQRLLWASTGTKNPAYADTLYVDELIGPMTVNTAPETTLEAFADHGRPTRTIDRDPRRDDERWAALHDAGIDFPAISERLEREGVASFIESFDDLVTTLTDKASAARR
jgi:transaldolase